VVRPAAAIELAGVRKLKSRAPSKLFVTFLLTRGALFVTLREFQSDTETGQVAEVRFLCEQIAFFEPLFQSRSPSKLFVTFLLTRGALFV
jgi:hypothetical protein